MQPCSQTTTTEQTTHPDDRRKFHSGRLRHHD